MWYEWETASSRDGTKEKPCFVVGIDDRVEAGQSKKDIIMSRSHAAVRGRHTEVVVWSRQGAVFDVFDSI